MIKSISSIKVSGQRVLVRVGFDVPLERNIHSEDWVVADDARIKDALKTINFLLAQKAKVIILSHLDRPTSWDKDKSLWPAAVKLGQLLNLKTVKVTDKLPDYDIPHVYFLDTDITKRDYSALSKKLKPGDILFLENLRFYPGESGNDEKFIDELAKYGDIFVNEAFSVSHRIEASTYGIALKMKSFAGFSFTKEIESLSKVLKNPQKPLVILMGGAKIADKVETINNLAKHAQHILIGGALANTFLKAKGYEIGKSKYAEESLAKELERNFKEKIILPLDVVVASSVDDLARCVPISKITANDLIMDIGPETIRKFSEYVKTAKTLVWNGPFGLIEHKKFSFGSESMSRIFAAQSKGKAFGVAGGGETLEVLDRAKVSEFVDHVSTGGGAMLEFLAGKKLPAIKALDHG